MSPDYSHLTERGLTQEVVFRGSLLRIRVDTVALPNGEIANREIAEHPGAVVILAVTPEDKVLLVRQFRYAVNGLSLELPAGCLDVPGEDVAGAARRELGEETGYQAQELTYLCRLHSSPGFTSETAHLFLASGLSKGNAQPMADEFLDLVELPMTEALAMVRRGDITDAKTVTGLLWLQQFGRTSEQSPPREGTLDDDEAS